MIPICGHLQLDVAVDESYFSIDLYLIVALSGLLGERCTDKDCELAFLTPCDESDPQVDCLQLKGGMSVYTS